MKKLLPILALLSSVSAFAGPQLPNPSAEYCLNHGGDYKSVSTNEGEDGLCVLGRAEIGAWTLFNNQGVLRESESPLAILAYKRLLKTAPTPPSMPPRGGVSSAGIPNPAAQYCVYFGGDVVFATNPQNGDTSGICKFPDNSTIEEWTLYSGYQTAENTTLTNLIQDQLRSVHGKP